MIYSARLLVTSAGAHIHSSSRTDLKSVTGLVMIFLP